MGLGSEIYVQDRVDPLGAGEQREGWKALIWLLAFIVIPYIIGLTIR